MGEGPLTIEADSGKGGKGKKGKGGGGGGNQVFVSLLDGWVKFQTDKETADHLQSCRASLQSAFQGFCQKPDLVPAPPVLEVLDQVAALISGLGDGAKTGVKRPAPGGDAMRNVAPRIQP